MTSRLKDPVVQSLLRSPPHAAAVPAPYCLLVSVVLVGQAALVLLQLQGCEAHATRTTCGVRR
jgi:hypothetical protein